MASRPGEGKTPMDPVSRSTLIGMGRELIGHPMRDADIDELVDPKLGIITGFQALLDQLESLRRIDLGALPPAQGVRRRPREECGS
jgi:hypothetical protein